MFVCVQVCGHVYQCAWLCTERLVGMAVHREASSQNWVYSSIAVQSFSPNPELYSASSELGLQEPTSMPSFLCGCWKQEPRFSYSHGRYLTDLNLGPHVPLFCLNQQTADSCLFVDNVPPTHTSSYHLAI